MTAKDIQDQMTTNDTQEQPDNAPAPETVDTVTEQPEPDNTEQAQEGNKHPGREAAKYRTQLREVEGERDGLQTKVAALQNSAALSIASRRLHVADDLFNVGGIDVEQLANDKGLWMVAHHGNCSCLPEPRQQHQGSCPRVVTVPRVQGLLDWSIGEDALLSGYRPRHFRLHLVLF